MLWNRLGAKLVSLVDAALLDLQTVDPLRPDVDIKDIIIDYFKIHREKLELKWKLMKSTGKI